MKKTLALLLAGVLAATTLVACGSSESTEDSTQAATATTEAAEAADATETTGEPLVIGTNAEFPPFEYVGDDGEPDGFDIALIKAIGEKLGREVTIENMEFDSLVSSIGTRIDGVIAGMTVTDERLEVVDFSDSYYDAVQYVVVLKDSNIATAEDLVGKTIGTQLGTTANFLAEDVEGATSNTYNRSLDAVQDLINGKVDAVIVDKNPALVFAENYADQVVAIDGADFGFEPEAYAIALPKGSDLVEQVNAALEELKADGTYDALVAEYIGESDAE